jgi:transposase-like protein
MMNILCKYCNSPNVIKFGTYTDAEAKDIQRYFCKDCKRKFTGLDTLPKGKTPIDQISSALMSYYGGMPLDAIQRHHEQQYGNYLSEAGIYKWVIRFTKEAITKAKDFKPNVGNVWLADETGINIGGKNYWFWDVIDAESRYLLASHVSLKRSTDDAQILIEKAIERAGKAPKVIITDKLAAYIDGIDLAGSGHISHLRSKPFVKEDSTNIIERFHGTFKQRESVMRNFNDINTARLLTEGWLIHYNFFKEHEALDNVSPVQHMKLPMPFKDWQDVVRGYSGKEIEIHFQLMPKAMPSTPNQIRSDYFRKAISKSRTKKRQQNTMPRLTSFR